MALNGRGLACNPRLDRPLVRTQQISDLAAGLARRCVLLARLANLATPSEATPPRTGRGAPRREVAFGVQQPQFAKSPRRCWNRAYLYDLTLGASCCAGRLEAVDAAYRRRHPPPVTPSAVGGKASMFAVFAKPDL